ncbi:MAG: glycosyltransferase family 39 protein, partial [Acidimicrobiia bacterium]
MNGNPLPSKPGWRSLEPTKLAVAAFAFIGLLLRGALVSRSLRAIDGLFIPDDTYYTLTIARSLAHGHGPTVDGSTLTSGFQPLLGFLMTPVFWFTSSSDTALRLDLVLLVIADTATILVIAWVAHRLAGRVAAVAAAAMWALSPIAISMALGGLETSLAILAQVGLVAVWIRARERDDTRHWIVVGVVAGLAVLARIDSLALVALLGALQLWRGTRPGLRPAAIAGAIVLAPWFGWCAVTFGTPIP